MVAERKKVWGEWGGRDGGKEEEPRRNLGEREAQQSGQAWEVLGLP